jgi:hypothetical protein
MDNKKKNDNRNYNNNYNSSSSNDKNKIEMDKSENANDTVYEVLTDNYFILLAIVSAIILIIIIYFFSHTFRVERAITTMEIYRNYMNLKSISATKQGNTRIGDYHISSAYNAAHCGYQMYDYTSEKIVLAVLQSGARYIEFNIFNSEFGPQAYPVVSMGYKSGEWKLTINDTPFEKILDIIVKNAFKLYDGGEGVDNPEDPLFIGLNLNTNSNLNCLNLMAYLITNKLGSRLLDNKYSFQNSDNIPNMLLKNAQGKVIIFSSDGFQGSGLEEIVNYSWDNTTSNPNHTLQRLYYKDITKVGFDKRGLIEFNRKGLTIIVPHVEGDFFNTNYNPIIAFELGCQFIAMEFQYVDSNMDYYITKFRNFSMIMKDATLLKKSKQIVTTTTTTTNTTTTTTTTTPITTSANPLNIP